ncbi:MAG: hypothetical protein H7A51_10185 [Akkermansiaceae bacterium]|nr:hypothetical protein [Akkermansiaceae bacterium]
MNLSTCSSLGLALIGSVTLLSAAEPHRVSMKQTAEGAWQLEYDGKPFFVRGAGGQQHLDVLVESGGNMIRTWGIESLVEKVDGKTLVDRARSHKLLIAAGIWVEHERHGFDYGDQRRVTQQREKIRKDVARWKHEPTIGFWGLGNEMEGPMSDGKGIQIWKELEELAKIVKKEDPSRLIMTVIAGASADKVKGIKTHCPSIDIIGINAYAAASGSGQAVKQAGWEKPFILSEFGPMGHWEVAQTAWKAPIEPSSRQKAAKYYAVHQHVVEASGGLCVGSFAFLWGQKQERTSTWYGMFLKSGEKLPPVDAMAKAWTGKWPKNRCPRVELFSSTAEQKTVDPGSTVHVAMKASDHEGAALSYEWKIAGESTDHKAGGDAEAVPPETPIKVSSTGDGRWHFKAPAKAGEYRLFLVVRDGHGAASAENFPFRVR